MTGQFLSACKLEVYIENPSRDSHYILNVCLSVHVSVHICDTLLILHLSPLYNVPFFLREGVKKKLWRSVRLTAWVGVNIFQGWIFFQWWIFFRGEYFSGATSFQVLIFFSDERFSGVNIFQRWIFVRVEYFSGWIFFRVLYFSGANIF